MYMCMGFYVFSVFWCVWMDPHGSGIEDCLVTHGSGIEDRLVTHGFGIEDRTKNLGFW